LDGVWEASVTRVAVAWVKEMGMQTGHRAHTFGLQVRIENRYACRHCEQSEKHHNAII